MVDKLHPKLEERVEPENWTEGIELPLALIDLIDEDPAPIAELAGHSIISSRQFSREQLVQLCRLAAKFETQQVFGQFPLGGKILPQPIPCPYSQTPRHPHSRPTPPPPFSSSLSLPP